MFDSNNIEMLFKTYNEELNILIGVFSIVLSLCSVIFGIKSYNIAKKSYSVAKDIFEKGIQLDKQKVLQQVSLEFVTNFFIPLKKLETMIELIMNNSCNEKETTYVKGLIRDAGFPVNFPYFDSHKGEVWNSLSICKDMDQAEAFNVIMDFLEKAKAFGEILKNLNDLLKKYLNPKEDDERKQRALSTLEDFFAINPSVNQEQFSQGMSMIKELLGYEKKLPKELKISQMKQSLLIGKDLRE